MTNKAILATSSMVKEDGRKAIKHATVRVARPGSKPGEKPSLVLPLPREVVDQCDIEAGDIFFFFKENDGNIKLVRPKI
jgi:hypothetical protein